MRNGTDTIISKGLILLINFTEYIYNTYGSETRYENDTYFY